MVSNLYTKALWLVSFAAIVLAHSGPQFQCGGIDFTGSTTCQTGWSCVKIDNGYSQCQQTDDENCLPGTNTTRMLATQTIPVASLCTQYAYHSTGDYALLNNLWGHRSATGGSQCTYYNGRVSGGAISFSSSWRWTGAPDRVKSYIYANRLFTRRRISQISRLPTTVQWSYDRTDMRANVAYDIFTHRNINNDHSYGEYEIMIWLAEYGGIWPLSESGRPVATVTLAGRRWNLYTGWNRGRNPPMRVYSFLPAAGRINSFSGDVMEFFRYLTASHSFPASSQYMLMYQFGTEAITGGPAYFNVPRYQADVV